MASLGPVAAALWVLGGLPTAGRAAAPATVPAAAPEHPPEASTPRPGGPPKRRRRSRARRAKLPMLHARVGRTWMFLAPVEAEAAAGYLGGWGLYPGAGAAVVVGASVAPTLRWRRGRLLAGLELGVRQREAWGLPVRQTSLGAALVLRGRPARAVTLGVRASLARLWRPGWPDLYQPLLDETGHRTGALGSTDRYGRLTSGVRVAATWAPSPGARLALDGGLEDRQDDRDPAFDPVLRPTHLTPGDRARVWARLGARFVLLDKTLRLRARVGYADLAYRFAFARDAGTGFTHATPGGAPANPLQRFGRVQVDARASYWWREGRTRLQVAPRFVHNADRFQGYYTYDAWGLGVGARVRPARGWRVALSYDLELRGYTHRGYQPGPGHPALDGGGGVRQDARHRVAGELSYALSRRRWEPYVRARWTSVTTTFPDYVPGLFPAGGPYAVDFDAAWLRADVGLRLRL